MNKVFQQTLLLISGIGTATVLTSSVHAQIPPHFRGTMCIIGASSGCTAQGFEVGMCGSARYQTPNIGGTGSTSTSLSVFWGVYAQNFFYNGSLLGTTWRTVTRTGINNATYQNTTDTSMRILGQSPADVTNAQAAIIVGQIIQFEPGCTISFRFAGPRKPGTVPAATPAIGLSNGGASLED